MKRLHHYSQHFLRDPRFVRELIERSKLKRTATVYDIGAGSGIITSALASYCKNVIAIESETKTTAILQRNIRNYSNVRVLTSDFMNVTLPSSPYSVFANIPFHLSSAIIRKLTEAPNPPTVCYLIVQKQFAKKLLPDHNGFTSQLGMMIGPEFTVRIRRHLKRTDFFPFPNVDTVLVEIIPRLTPLLPADQIGSYKKFTNKCFTNPIFFTAILKQITPHSHYPAPSAARLDEWINFYKAYRSMHLLTSSTRYSEQ